MNKNNNKIKRYPPKEEKINIISHFVGFILSIIGSIILVVHAILTATIWSVVSFSIFGLTLILLYLISTIYHSTKDDNLRKKMRILDHCSIFLLIAGTYTPFSLLSLHGKTGWIIFGTVWSLALIGIVLKIFFTGKYNFLSTLMYILMGWVIVLAIKPLIKNLPPEGVILLFAGGISYTLGGILYGIKKIKFNHAIFHFFVLIGSLSHYFAMFFVTLAK